MEIRLKQLHWYSVLYIYVNIIIFMLGWVRGLISIPCVCLIAYSLYLYRKKQTDISKKIIVSKTAFFIISITALIWCVCSGQGTFVYQTYDWMKHNAILRDLINYSWPVRYVLENNSYAYLSYYIGDYLFSALIGKVFGFRIAEMILLIQNFLGVLLVFLNIIGVVNAVGNKRQIAVCVIFILFGGFTFFAKNLYSYLKPDDIVQGHYLWMSRSIRIQYTDNINLLSWVFPQCIVTWLATAWFIESRKEIENYALVALPIFLYSTFAFVGIMLLFGIEVLICLSKNFKKTIKTGLSIQNIFAVLSMAPVFILYIAPNVFQKKPFQLNFEIIDYSGKWSLYFLFCFFNFFIWGIFIFKRHKKNSLLYISTILLFIFPFFTYGEMNDLCMRGSIPALFIYAVFVIDILIRSYNDNLNRMRRKAYLIAFLFLIAAIPQINFIYTQIKSTISTHQARRDDWDSIGNYIQVENRDEYISAAYNYVAYNAENSIFERYISKPRKKK